MKANVITLFLICLSFCSYAQNGFKSGLLISGGGGDINYSVPDNDMIYNASYKSNFSLGYRFRIQPPLSKFLIFDLDANIGAKLWNSSYCKAFDVSAISDKSSQYDYSDIIHDVSSQYYYCSVGASANYAIYKGLKVGAGMEPTYYFRQNGEASKNNFDIPLVAKVAYDFGFLEIGVNYKHGLFNVLETKYLESGKMREWQLSVFIPFH